MPAQIGGRPGQYTPGSFGNATDPVKPPQPVAASTKGAGFFDANGHWVNQDWQQPGYSGTATPQQPPTSLRGIGGPIGPTNLGLPQPAPNWADQTKPGVGETGATKAADALMNPGAAQQNWDATKGQWSQPTASEGYWQGVAGKFQGGGPAVSNMAQSAYDTYMKDRPSLSLDPNMGKFYDNAATRFNQDTNTQLGSRGAFNSSAALDKIAQGNATLRGQQAKDEAQYGLDRAGVINQQGAVSGNLAAGADLSSRGAAKTSLDYLTEGGVLAGDASKSGLDRLIGGARAAEGAGSETTNRLEGAATAYLGAQGARDSRVQNAFANIDKLGGQLKETVSGWAEKMLSNDSTFFDAVNSGELARAAEKLGMSHEDANKLMADLKALFEAATAGKGGKG